MALESALLTQIFALPRERRMSGDDFITPTGQISPTAIELEIRVSHGRLHTSFEYVPINDRLKAVYAGSGKALVKKSEMLR